MDFQSYTKVKTSSEKNFGIVLIFFLFAIFAMFLAGSTPIILHPLFKNGFKNIHEYCIL